MSKVFLDKSGRWTWIVNGTEWDLGYYRPDKYIWADNGRMRKQVCDGGGWRGNTLSWPGGRILSFREATNKLGQKFSIPEYEELPDAKVLKWLAKHLDAQS